MCAADVRLVDAAYGLRQPSKFTLYLEEAQAGDRSVLVARTNERVVGFVTVRWQSLYPPFREAAIPEIVDLDVLPEFRRRGAGSALLDHAEQLIRSRLRVAGIAVGLHAGYGAAQRLYAKRGYVPDGRGLWLSDHYIEEGEHTSVGDEARLYLIKDL
jgi:ribosomal protein S18 acetylase RimI-like enzyme